MRNLLLCGAIAALLLTALPSLALADAAGKTKGVNPAAGAQRDGAMQTLVVGSDVFINDIVQTGPKGQVQILFADNTKLVVGPASTLKIEDYLIRNNGSAGKLAVDMLAGSFRFATGDAAKNRYRIDTPTGTIGVRGTRFDVHVDRATGITSIMHYLGVVRFCTLRGKCQELSELCTIGQLSNDAVILGDARLVQGNAARDRIKAQFIYSNNQSPLLGAFRFANAYGCTHNLPNVPVPPPNNHDNSRPIAPPRSNTENFGNGGSSGQGT